MDFVEGFVAIFMIGVCFLIWLLPILLIAVSNRTGGKEKAAWILAVIFISWFAWVFYLLLAPLNKPSCRSDRDYDRYYRRYR